MVVVFIPRETTPGETRVSATPETIKALVKKGLEVQVEKGAGDAAGFVDAAYADAGAKLADRAAMSAADMVLGIRPPSEDDAGKLKSGAYLVCGMQPMLSLPVVKKLAAQNVTTYAMDLMPRITRAQKMDVLSSQATVAGYLAVLLGATNLPKMFPLFMTAAGTITPARIVILGAGVAGLQAIATAKRLGAVVEANDIRSAVKEQVESLGGRFIDTGTPPDAETSGGYAKETSEEFQRKQREILTNHIKDADVVIATALIPGRKAPTLMTAEMVAAMKPGAVIVDMAAPMGGNVVGTVPGERVKVGGVLIIGDENLPAHVPADASRMYARNISSFLDEFVKDGALAPDYENNDVLPSVRVTDGGQVTHQGAKDALEKGGA